MAALPPPEVAVSQKRLAASSVLGRDARSGRVAIVAHCILNQNSVVLGLAREAAAVRPLVDILLDFNLGILQLPCPELAYGGLRRFWQSREQYDTPLFRAHCRRLAREVAEAAAVYAREGMVIPIVIGIAGSPSCGAEETSSSEWMGNPAEAAKPSQRVPGMGVFMEELTLALREEEIEPMFIDYDRKRAAESIERIRRILMSKL